MRMNSKNKMQHSYLKIFNIFMSRGKFKNAIRVLSDEHKGGVLAPTNRIDGRPVLEIYAPWCPTAIRANIHARFTTSPLFSTKSVPGSSDACNEDMAVPGRQVSMPMTGVVCLLLSGKPPRTWASSMPNWLRGWPLL